MSNNNVGQGQEDDIYRGERQKLLNRGRPLVLCQCSGRLFGPPTVSSCNAHAHFHIFCPFSLLGSCLCRTLSNGMRASQGWGLAVLAQPQIDYKARLEVVSPTESRYAEERVTTLPPTMPLHMQSVQDKTDRTSRATRPDTALNLPSALPLRNASKHAGNLARSQPCFTSGTTCANVLLL